MKNQGSFVHPIALLALFSSLSGCGMNDRPYEISSPLTASLASIRLAGVTDPGGAMSSLTQFTWDQLYFFRDHTSKNRINEIISADLFDNTSDTGFDSGFYVAHGPLLVFLHDGRVVHAVSVEPPISLQGEPGVVYSPENAYLTTFSSYPTGPFSIRLIINPGDTGEADDVPVDTDNQTPPPACTQSN